MDSFERQFWAEMEMKPKLLVNQFLDPTFAYFYICMCIYIYYAFVEFPNPIVTSLQSSTVASWKIQHPGPFRRRCTGPPPRSWWRQPWRETRCRGPPSCGSSMVHQVGPPSQDRKSLDLRKLGWDLWKNQFRMDWFKGKITGNPQCSQILYVLESPTDGFRGGQFLA